MDIQADKTEIVKDIQVNKTETFMDIQSDKTEIVKDIQVNKN